jgi:hypothetical protein
MVGGQLGQVRIQSRQWCKFLAYSQGIFSQQHSMQRSRGTSEQEDCNATTLEGVETMIGLIVGLQP